ncbi:putative LysR family transcriptional regulator [Arthrobacter globiformis NBRC 12137]|uniref:Putative LysR family transcriptional regulator n=1 Tax=Arthrobacter globiformis (strain ATCC 8010 / DSM 20124 / JCM 1332 / NBRC 12137 / NCIMB 8907 / NRRL B-2979 / 168) TaxID=1077972 RepID=H0QMM7_ARTG1|nr:LysR family transcriptional regulator [Arthrobacter globiformis]GAB14078.1 putative LysR family transcriptional regulator [Arthrobacter globiformis NBRC 12137]
MHTDERPAVDLRRLPSPDDLLILLTVARLGRFNAVAETLGTTHTTISRRILALDKQLGGRTLERSPQGWELTQLGAAAVEAAEAIENTLGSLSGLISQDQSALSGLVRVATTDGVGAVFVTPALVRLQQQNPQLNIEMLSATRKVSQNRSGVDLEIVVGRTDVSNAQTIFLSNYYLRLYASPGYAAEHGLPETLDDVGQHGFVSYVESALQVAELGHRWSSQLPMPTSSFQATSVFAQVEAVRQGAGIGLLPNFMVAGQPDFVPVLAGDFERQLPIWAVARPESLRSAAVQAVIASLKEEVKARAGLLAG